MYLNFKSTMTRAGAQRRAEALTGAPTAQWTEVVLGDADNNGVGPRTYFPPIDENTGYTTQTQLVNPVWDGEIDSLQVGEDGHTLVLNFIVPKEVGAFFFTEIAVKDENGNLLFIGTAAEAQYKPRLIPVNDGAAVFSFTISMTGDSTLKIKGEKGDQGDKGDKGDRGNQGLRGFAGYGNAWLKTFDENLVDDVSPLANETGQLSLSVDGAIGSCMRIMPSSGVFAGELDRGFAVRVPSETSAFLMGNTSRFQLFARKEQSDTSRFAFAARVGTEWSDWQYRTLTDEFEPYYFDWDVPVDVNADLEIVIVAGIDSDEISARFDLVAASLASPVTDDEASATFEATVTRKIIEFGIGMEGLDSEDISDKLELIERKLKTNDLYFNKNDHRVEEESRRVDKVIEDLDGTHNVGGDFNFGIARDLKEWKEISLDRLESEAMIWRATGQSGITMMRQYRYGGDASHFRPNSVSFSALGVHDHPNYPLMSGMPELQAAINGFPLHTRHTDYRWKEASSGEYLDNVDAVAPDVPPEVSEKETVAEQTEEMRKYYRALSTFDESKFPGFRNHADLHVAYLEMWFEEVEDSRLVDAVHSFRHAFDSQDVTEMHKKMISCSMTGFKHVNENGSFMPRIVQMSNENGSPRYAITRYRVMTKRLGNLSEWPIDSMVALHDDPVTRLRSGLRGQELSENRMARFRVLHDFDDSGILARTNSESMLDRIMGAIPGLEGPGADIEERYFDTNQIVTVTKHKDTTTHLNAANYNRWYSHPRGAAGRSDAQRGFNDPTLYVARNNRPEVSGFEYGDINHRVSWAIPLELIVTAPHMSWNPHGFDVKETKAEVVDGGMNGSTPESALWGISQDAYWNMTPDDFYAGAAANPDPADTRTGAWIRSSDGTPQLARPSGVYVFMPEIEDCGPVRLRYPIAPVHHEGNFVHGYTSAVREEIGELQTSMVRDMLEFKQWAKEESKILHELRDDRERNARDVSEMINSIHGDLRTIRQDMATARHLDDALTRAFDTHEEEHHSDTGV